MYHDDDDDDDIPPLGQTARRRYYVLDLCSFIHALLPNMWIRYFDNE